MAMYKGGHDELFGAYANSILWQNYQSNTICNSELVPSLVVGVGPIFNNFITFDDLAKELEFHPDL